MPGSRAPGSTKPRWFLLALLLALLGGLAVLFAPRGDVAEDEPSPVSAPPRAPSRADAPAEPGAPGSPSPPATRLAARAPVEESAPSDLDQLPLAERLFEESRRWIAGGATPAQALRDAHLALDARFDLEGSRHEGSMKLWLQLPDLYRQELTTSNATTVKVLNAGNLWARHADGAFQHRNRQGADGIAAAEQAVQDRERVTDLARFLTLEGLKGPGVTFEFEGEKQPSGNFARRDGGTWAKIVRRSPGQPNTYFWLAHQKDAAGVMRATYPGVVRVDGTPFPGVPAEFWLLSEWTSGDAAPRRRAGRIQAFQMLAGEPPHLFLDARVLDVRINAGSESALFEPR